MRKTVHIVLPNLLHINYRKVLIFLTCLSITWLLTSPVIYAIRSEVPSEATLRKMGVTFVAPDESLSGRCELGGNQTQPVKSLFFIGDSLTYGSGKHGELLQRAGEAGYTVTPTITDDPNDDLARITGPSIEAIGGYNTTNIVPYLKQHEADFRSVEGIVVAMGTNIEANFQTKIENLVTYLRSINSAVKIFWVNTNYTANRSTTSAMVNADILAASQKLGFTVIDIAKATAEDSTLNLAPDGGDGVHFSIEGYKRRSRFIVGAISSVGPAATPTSTTGTPLPSTNITAHSPPSIATTAQPGINGSSITKTLDDVHLGLSTYVTLSGDPSNFGKTYTIPSITYTNKSGEVITLSNIIGYVHDSDQTVGPVASTPEGTYKIAIGIGYTPAQVAQTFGTLQLIPTANPSAPPTQGLGSNCQCFVGGTAGITPGNGTASSITPGEGVWGNNAPIYSSGLSAPYTIEMWAIATLRNFALKAGVPEARMVTQQKVFALIVWSRTEGGGIDGHNGDFNPLNLKENASSNLNNQNQGDSSTDSNSSGYTSFDHGVEGTTRRLFSKNFARVGYYLLEDNFDPLTFIDIRTGDFYSPSGKDVVDRRAGLYETPQASWATAAIDGYDYGGGIGNREEYLKLQHQVHNRALTNYEDIAGNLLNGSEGTPPPLVFSATGITGANLGGCSSASIEKPNNIAKAEPVISETRLMLVGGLHQEKSNRRLNNGA